MTIDIGALSTHPATMGEILHFVDSPEDLGDAPDQPAYSGNLPPHTHLARDLWQVLRFFVNVKNFLDWRLPEATIPNLRVLRIQDTNHTNIGEQ